MKPTVIALVGPTCSGKTALSLKLARHFPLEIIACDSRTIYQEMDIGTAKPSKDEQAAVKHHLLDVVKPNESYTVVEFRQAGRKAIADITAAGSIPVVCGGTGFYARALLSGLEIPQVEPQAELRAELKQLADTQGNQCLHDKLQKIDPLSASRINANDRFRLIRALEVSQVLGVPFSQAATRGEDPYNTIWLGITSHDRQLINNAIEKRFSQQLKDGLLEEVEGLWKRYGPCRSLLNTVNYQELLPIFTQQANRQDCYQTAITHNCQLVRRQLIWFRANPEIHWLHIDESGSESLPQQALSYLQDRLKALKSAPSS